VRRTAPSLPVHNVHRRRLPTDLDTAGALLETLGRVDDALWPAHGWMPLWLDGPIRLGTTGGHGPARYRVVSHQPGRLVRFRFHEPSFMVGYHEFSVEPDGPGHVVLQHALTMQLGVLGWPVFPVAFLALHNEVIEQALDGVERRLTGTVARPTAPSRRNAVRRALLRRYFELTGSGPSRRRPRPLPDPPDLEKETTP
jgi:hypothetical protein